jgi:hypothetical protein
MNDLLLEPPSPCGAPPESPDESFPFDDAEPPRSPAVITLETRGLKPQNHQSELFDKALVLKASIVAKLHVAGLNDLADTLDACGTRKTFCKCNACGKLQIFFNRCDNAICPVCQPKLARDRRRDIDWWANQVRQPKHVVLTLRNVPTLERGHLVEAKSFLTKLRRSKFAKDWRGGCWSLEITNEGRGWHIHFHLLIDADWIDAKDLAKQWHKSTNGAGFIVKVKDARKEDYLKELVKYCVKGTELARWNPDDLAMFVAALQDGHTFGVFGSLRSRRKSFKEFQEETASKHHLCPCGSDNCKLMSEHEYYQWQLEPQWNSTRPGDTTTHSSNLDLWNDSCARRNLDAVRN